MQRLRLSVVEPRGFFYWEMTFNGGLYFQTQMAFGWVGSPCEHVPQHMLLRFHSRAFCPFLGEEIRRTHTQLSLKLQARSLNCKESHLGWYCDWVSSSQCQHGLSLRPVWKEASREGWEEGERKLLSEKRGQVEAWTESMGRVGDESRAVGKASGYADHAMCQPRARAHTHDHCHSPGSATVPFRDGERLLKPSWCFTAKGIRAHLKFVSQTELLYSDNTETL